MIIYTDQGDAIDGVYGETATPAHHYEGTIDFTDILNDLLNGKIPFNTKHVYPTVWKSDREVLEQERRMSQQPNMVQQPWTK